MRRRVICLRCRRERAHHSRGLCSTCANRLRDLDHLHLYPPVGPGGRPKSPPTPPEPIEFKGQWVRRGLVYYPFKETA